MTKFKIESVRSLEVDILENHVKINYIKVCKFTPDFIWLEVQPHMACHIVGYEGHSVLVDIDHPDASYYPTVIEVLNLEGDWDIIAESTKDNVKIALHKLDNSSFDKKINPWACRFL